MTAKQIIDVAACHGLAPLFWEPGSPDGPCVCKDCAVHEACGSHPALRILHAVSPCKNACLTVFYEHNNMERSYFIGWQPLPDPSYPED
jgi:hypothetical protein